MWPNGNASGGGPPQNQPPQGWSPQPPNGQYPARQPPIPPISAALPPHQQQPPDYRNLPAPQQMYPQAYAQPVIHHGYPPPAHPAPRQRTAIACRYCRRRKIRCSGFDQSEDGKCTNCQRFSQECIFTPVSAQTQAFVPAHSIYRGVNPPSNTQLYGAYGQPLPQYPIRDQYQQGPPPQQQQQQQQQPGQYPQPPAGYQQPPMYGQAQPHQGTPGSDSGRKRGNDEPHTPTLPPPNPAMQRDGQQAYAYPDPSMMHPDGKDADAAAAAAHAAAAASARREEALRLGQVKDAGVQVDLLRKE